MHGLDDVQNLPLDTQVFEHLPQQSTQNSIKDFLEICKAIVQLATPSLPPV